jgi:hypothetical protein
MLSQDFPFNSGQVHGRPQTELRFFLHFAQRSFKGRILIEAVDSEFEGPQGVPLAFQGPVNKSCWI